MLSDIPLYPEKARAAAQANRFLKAWDSLVRQFTLEGYLCLALMTAIHA